MKLIDYTKIIKIGDRNNNMEVIELPYRKPRPNGAFHEWYVRIKCDCGKVQNVQCIRWHRKEFASCRGCQLAGSNNYAWNGCGEINGQVFTRMRLDAERRKIKYSVSKEYLWNLFLKQERKCALTGLEIKFRFNNGEQTASLDRIDSSRGYVEGNLQWIHKVVNIMKNGYSQEDFIQFCKLIYEHNRNRIQGKTTNVSNRRRIQ